MASEYIFSLDVKMFDKFSVTDGIKIMNKETLRSEMLIRLLSFILFNSKKMLTVSELSETLWEEDESDNPVGALKNLMYRLRTILNKNFGTREYIITGRGFYQWNDEIPVRMDIKDFEIASSKIIGNCADDVIIESGREMLRLYKGKFLPELSSQYWIVSKSTYYHSLFLTAGKKYAEALINNQLYDEAEDACQKAISIDSYEEEVHVMLIRTLLGKNKQNLALKHYQETVDLLYDALGVKPSGELLELYSDIKNKQHDVEENMDSLHGKLVDQNWTRGPLFAEFATFQEIYTFMSYSGARLGIAVQMALITLDTRIKMDTESPKHHELMRIGMGTLKDVLAASLRTNDIVYRYSQCQYLVLLTACQYEAGRLVMERIKQGFEKVEVKMRILIKYSLDEIAMQQ